MENGSILEDCITFILTPDRLNAKLLLLYAATDTPPSFTATLEKRPTSEKPFLIQVKKTIDEYLKTLKKDE